MAKLTRRDFLQHSALLSAAVAGAGTLANPLRAEEKTAKKGAASEQLRVACIGVRGRGRDHIKGFAGRHNCLVTTICDVDLSDDIVGPASKMIEKAQGSAPRIVQDLRVVMEDKNIDIVSIATPNHWHSLAAIWAMQAGKDVYVEKPVSHNVHEGRILVEIARKFKRICQAGTQIRSSSGMRAAMEYLHAGKLGKLQVARGLCYKSRPSIGKVNGPQPLPKTIDYDLWCGPAPKTPLMRKKLHYDWHWIWDYGNGDLGNQGIHQMDVARWGLGKNELCKAAFSVGGRFGYIDDGQTANTQICLFDYGDAELIFEVRGLPTTKYQEVNVGNVFHCTDGILVCPGYTEARAYSPKGELLKTFKGGEDHYGNFVKAVRSRKSSDLNAEILEGHLSSALCHLGNISYRLGTAQPFNKATQPFGDDKAASETFGRMCEHLKNNMVGLADATYMVGRHLKVDPTREMFMGDKEANAMLTREYRKGFEVPAKV